MWIGARTERTLRIVHDANLKSAQEAELTLEEWHKMMSRKGNQMPEIVYESDKSDDEIARESARWIGDYHHNLLKGFSLKKKK